MSGLDTDAGTVTISGGFVIEIRPDELTAYSAGSVRSLHSKPTARLFSYIFAALYFLIVGLFEFIRFDGLICFLLLILPLYILLRYFFVGDQNLHCSREVLDVVCVKGGKIKQIESLQRTEVRQIRYGTDSYSKNRPIGALIFNALNQRKRILRGLKCIEALEILNQLTHWGYDVVPDSAMPMTIEMEEERRKSRLS